MVTHHGYIANGICGEAAADERLHGRSEFRLFNPTPHRTDVRMRVFFSDRTPVTLDPWPLDGFANRYLAVPQFAPQVFAAAGPWGMTLESTEPVLTDHILVAGLKGDTVSDRFAGGVSDVLAEPAAAKTWWFGDGLRLAFNPQTAPIPYNEFEWYHLLNPGPRDADIVVTRFYGPGDETTQRLTLAAERVMLLDNFDTAPPNRGHGIRFSGTEPIVVQSTRLIYSLHGLGEWGAQIHTPRPGRASATATIDQPHA